MRSYFGWKFETDADVLRVGRALAPTYKCNWHYMRRSRELVTIHEEYQQRQTSARQRDDG